MFEATSRAKEIISSLLTFARRPENELEETDVGFMIDQVLILLERELNKSEIEVVRDYRFVGNVLLDVGAMQH